MECNDNRHPVKRRVFIVFLLFAAGMIASAMLRRPLRPADVDASTAHPEGEVNMATPPRMDRQIETVLCWLPHHTESILWTERVDGEDWWDYEEALKALITRISIVDGKPVSLTFDRKSGQRVDPPPLPTFRAEAFRCNLTLVESAFGDRTGAVLAQSKAALSAICKHAPRRDIRPRTICQACQVVFFQRPVGETISRELNRPDVTQVRIPQGVIWEVPGRYGSPPGFVTQPGPLLVAVCTSADLAKTLLVKSRERKPRQLPGTDAAWKNVDCTAPVWGFRHYRHETADLDRARSSMLLLDRHAVGLTFWWENLGTPELRGRYVSGEEQGANSVRQLLEDGLDLRVRTRRVSANVTEFQLSLDSSGETPGYKPHEVPGIMMLLLGWADYP